MEMDLLLLLSAVYDEMKMRTDWMEWELLAVRLKLADLVEFR